MEHDVEIKRAKFINLVVEVDEDFKAATQSEDEKALKVYSSSFYDYNLWDCGEKARKLFNSWSWPGAYPSRLKHKYCSMFFHLASALLRWTLDIFIRFVKFFHGLRSSASYEVQVLSRLLAIKLQSVTGRNLNLVQEMTRLNPWTTTRGKLKAAPEDHEKVDVPLLDRWRCPTCANSSAREVKLSSMQMKLNRKD